MPEVLRYGGCRRRHECRPALFPREFPGGITRRPSAPQPSAVARRMRWVCGRKVGVMRSTSLVALSVCALSMFSAPALAQRPVNFSIGGGLTTPNSSVRDHLGNGYNFNIGLQGNITPVIGIEGLYSFSGLGDKNISIPVYPQPLASGGVPTNLSGSMNMQYGTASLVVQRPTGGVRPYGL